MMANLKIDTILFDLDDTLLGNQMDQFLKSYFYLVAEHMQVFMPRERFLDELMVGTQAMIANPDAEATNREVFWSVFGSRTGLSQRELEPYIEEFYRGKFGSLRSHTNRRPIAAELVGWCFESGLKVIIATNPLFPRTAIEQRLAWAGIPVEEYGFTLVTTYENMHSTKPHVAYYQEILDVAESEPESALMVGDDWGNDIRPSAQIGMYTYWVTADEVTDPDKSHSATGQGTLDSLHCRLKSGWLTE